VGEHFEELIPFEVLDGVGELAAFAERGDQIPASLVAAGGGGHIE
jgi:hypothetical protein